MTVFGVEIGAGGTGLGWLDMILLAVIIIAWPIYAHINRKMYPIEEIRDDPNIRTKSYNLSLLELWGLTIAILLVWGIAERSFEALGFQYVPSLAMLVVWGVALFGLGYSAWQLYGVHTNQETRQNIAKQLRDVGEMTQLLMPKTNREYWHSMLLAVTAGITEEVIFRGYLIWALGLFVPIWAASILSVCVFVFLHLYQKTAGLIQVTAFAVVATIMYIACGSLWPVIILHIGIDVLNISLARRVWQKADA